MSQTTSTSTKPSDTVDRELELRVREALSNHGRHSINHVAIHVDQGRVTIYGTVKSFYERQLCIRACQQIDGLHELIDKIEVVNPS